MRAVIQRVSRAEVRVNNEVVSEIQAGIFTLLGIAKNDTEDQLNKLIRKIVELRIFEDENGKMNRSLVDTGGSHLIVSQFTLAGDTSAGRRPSFVNAERPELAKPIYEKSLLISKELGVPTSGGIFQADMKIELVNDGPVTFVLDA
jgi:D-tyrosyl-tRNA(Tyr) deacylase